MISILMSTYNPIKEYFKKCLDSIFSQTYQEYEIVLVDDGSKERVIEYLNSENINLKKIRYIRLEENVGLPKALNIGLKECKGEYIARMDDDDIMSSTRLERQLNYIQDNNLDGCFTWFEEIDKLDNIISSKNIEILNEKMLEQLLNKGNIFCHASLFIRKEVLERINGYDENLRYAQDSELYIRILENYRMGIVKEYLIQHRVNDYRNTTYRETLSLTYALFGAMNYYTSKEKLKFKERINIIIRLARYYISILRISKKNRNGE